MSTLLMHNIEPFFCSNQSNNTNISTITGHNNDEDHLSYPNVSGVVGFHESLAQFSLDSDAISTGDGNGSGNGSSPLNNNNHHHHHHHHHHFNPHDLYGTNGNYHHLLTINTANDQNQNYHHFPILDGDHQELLENQLVQHYSTTTTTTTGSGCGFSTANHSNDIKTEFILDEYNNNNHNHNHNHGNNPEINCLSCILDEYPLQIENTSPSPAPASAWLIKSPEQWLPSEVAQWIRGWAQTNEIQDIEVAHLLYNQMAGLELCQMQREYFTTVCPQYGDLIFDSLQSLLQQFRCSGQPTSTISSTNGSSCFTISSSSSLTNTGNGSLTIHCMEDNANNDDNNNNNNDRPTITTRESESESNDAHHHHHHSHHHHHHHQQQHQKQPPHHNLLPVMGVYCSSSSNNNNNNSHADLLSTVSRTIFQGSSPPQPTTMDHQQQTQLHQHQHQHSPSYAFDSDDRESTSSTSYSNDRKISSLNSTTYFHSSPQSTTSSILNNSQINLQQQPDRINIPFNENNGLSPLKHHRSNNNHGLNNNNNNGRRGRPPKKENKSRSKGNGKLWEFIRDLLLNPVTNPSLIRWERREDGIFKFIQSDKVAKMWGERKQNPRMTYEKLSRAMRYYYKSQVLLPVFGRRLVYKFGPNATGWRPTTTNHGSPVPYDDSNKNNDNNENIDYSTTTTIIACEIGPN